MNKGPIFLLIVVMTALVSACSNMGINSGDRYFPYTAYPFQTSDDANWGMVSSNGKVIFQDEFRRLPSRVANDRFIVKTKDSLLTYYIASEKPSKIGKQYVFASDFSSDGYAVVSQEKDGIQVINKDGKTVYSLDKNVGQQVDMMTPFNENGLSVFTVGHNQGVINSSGKVILKPRYYTIVLGNGSEILAIDKKYEENFAKEDYKNVEVNIFNSEGNSINKFNLGKFVWVSNCIDGNYVAYEKVGDDSISGLIDNSGSWIVKPTKDTKKITDCKYGVFVYFDGDQYGLKSTKGEDLIRAKYDNLVIAGDNLIWAYENDDNVLRCKLIDFNDNQIGEDTYKSGGYFSNGWALAQINDNDWIFINSKGEENQEAPNISKIDCMFASSTIFSNYLDINELINQIKLTPCSLNGFNIGISASDACKKAYQLNDSIYTDYIVGKKSSDFEYTSKLDFGMDFHNTRLEYEIGFDGYISDDKGFTKATAYGINLDIPFLYNANGRLKDIYKRLASILKKYGKVVKSNVNAIVVEGDKCVYCSAMAGDHVTIALFRKGSINPKTIDIEQYKNIKEKNWLTDNSIFSSNEEESDYDEDDIDTTAVDTTAADYDY